MPAVAVWAALASGLALGDGAPAVPDADLAMVPKERQAADAAARFLRAVKAGRLEDAAAASDLPWCYYGRVVPADRKAFERFLAAEGDGIRGLAEVCPDVVEVVRWPQLRERNLGSVLLPALDSVLDDRAYFVYIGQKDARSCDAVLVVFRGGAPRVVGMSH
jgi:hypothetical protein